MEETVLQSGQSAQHNRMRTQPVGRLLFSMAVPLALSMLIQALYNVVDSIFVARISEDALTAVSLASPMNMLMISFGVGTAVGVNSLIARRLGARRFEEANAAAVNGLLLAVLTALVFLLFGFFGAGPFIRAYTQDAQIAQMGTEYLSLCAIFGLGIFVSLTAERIMQAQGKPFYSMLMQLTGAVTNLILDPILIFGLLGFPALGVRGAAIATVAGQWLSMLLSIFIMAGRRNDLRIRLRGFKPSARIIRDIYAVGAPSIIMQGIGTVLTVGMNAILIGFSSTAVAVFGAYFKVQSFVLMPMIGMMNAAISIEAYNFGARLKSRLMRTWRMSLLAGVSMMLVGTGLVWLFSREIMALFDASPSMAAMGVAALRTMSACLPLAAVNISISIVYQAVGRGVYSMLLSLLRQLVVLLPAAWILSRVFGEVNAVWFSFLVAETATVFI
ncbi:MAG: MATE family efflux transporter, partial [Clostridia bacterium]|nr:MATE family efflux transporter [Clostridia bacterium]